MEEGHAPAGRYGPDEARRYEHDHPEQMAAAPATVAALADLAALARARGLEAGLPPPGSRRVLELGVGTGRLAVPLAGTGLEVWGIDDAEAMVEVLRAKPGAEAVGVVVGDLADVATLAEGEFAMVFVAESTLFELGDQDAQVACFAGVAAHLAPGGLFVVEAHAPDVTRLEESVAVTALGPRGVTLQATRHDPATQVVAGTDVVLSAQGMVLRPWSIRYATPAELDLMARLAGLARRDRWASWQGHPFTATSPRHVSVYERATPPGSGRPR